MKILIQIIKIIEQNNDLLIHVLQGFYDINCNFNY